MKNDNLTNPNDPSDQPGDEKSVSMGLGKRVIRFIIHFALLYPAISVVIHYDKKHDFSFLTIIGLFILAIAVIFPVFELICKKLGLSDS